MWVCSRTTYGSIHRWGLCLCFRHARQPLRNILYIRICIRNKTATSLTICMYQHARTLLIMCSDQDHTELMVLVSSHSLIALNRGCLSCTYLLGIESGNESNNSLTRLQNADAICVYFFCLCSIADSRKDRYVAWSRIVDTSKSIFSDIKLHMHACLFVLRNFNATIRSLLSIWYVWHQRMLNPDSVQIIQWIQRRTPYPKTRLRLGILGKLVGIQSIVASSQPKTARGWTKFNNTKQPKLVCTEKPFEM